MHALKIYVEDRVFDKVMYFLNNLPSYEVKIVEETPYHQEPDFIAKLSESPLIVDDSVPFLTRDEVYVR